MIKVFIGFDPNEEVAFHVLSQSIHKYASSPVSITPIRLSQLKGIFNREREPLQSTQFSFSRFLVPYLSEYEGFSIFIDCDMLFLDDIVKLIDSVDKKYAISVVKHNHNPTEDKKFLNQIQSKYQRKNWSSVIVFNNTKCKALTPDFVNTATGLQLHQFKWLKDEQIGSLDIKYNHLVEYTQNTKDIINLHYTKGGAYFKEYENCQFSKEWRDALVELLYATDKSDFLQKAINNIKI
jgi:lipopolysaccharide biosynthesis glycosyltransferase